MGARKAKSKVVCIILKKFDRNTRIGPKTKKDLKSLILILKDMRSGKKVMTQDCCGERYEGEWDNDKRERAMECYILAHMW